MTLFELNSTPPVLPVIDTGPVSLLPAHGPVAASPPISTSPVVPVIVIGPEKFPTPHMRNAVAPVERSVVAIVPPSMSRAPPGFTVIGPATTAPGAMQIAWPAVTVSGSARTPVMHGCE